LYVFRNFVLNDWQGKKEIPNFLQECEKLDDYKMFLLDELKRKIWDAQEKVYEQRLKDEKKEERKKEQKPYLKQMKLF
jgi:hypothetical protein